MHRPLSRSIMRSHLFPAMVDFVRQRYFLRRSRSAFKMIGLDESTPFVNPPLRLVDIWSMSIKRPEAHLRPNGDCLHWCMTGILDYWHEVSRLEQYSLAEEGRQ